MHKCWGDPRRRFAPTKPGSRVVDAHRTRGLYFYGQILLWPPKYAHERPVDAALLGCRNVGGTPAFGLHAAHPVVASWTHTVRVVWTCSATYFYCHPGTHTDGQCKRRDWNAEELEMRPPLVCTHNTRRSRRGRTPYAWFGLLWPEASVATHVRPRMARASGVIGMQQCRGGPRRRLATTGPSGRVVDAHRTRGLNFYGQILLWPIKYAHEWPVEAV